MGDAIHKQIFDEYRRDHAGQDILYDQALRTRPAWIRPDIANYTQSKIGEIKPFSSWGFATGEFQVTAGLAFANGITFRYRGHDFPILPRVPHGGPPGDWIEEDWQPGVRIIYPGQVSPRFQNWIAVTLFNVDGVIYYKRLYVPRPATLLVLSLLMLKEKVDVFVDDMIRDVRLGLDYGTELI
ncbi:MAG: hypothetical protein GXY55_15815 [Phycisphaerae bacterium]|nr:hypothetical protein [Phycisphaerae bacterium]